MFGIFGSVIVFGCLFFTGVGVGFRALGGASVSCSLLAGGGEV